MMDLTDEALIELIRKNDDKALDFLIEKYKSFVKIKARSYFLIGADKDDVIQEGMIGLYKAIREFDGEKSPSFKPFAELCVVRGMISAIKATQRQKHRPLYQYISLDNEEYGESAVFAIGGGDPEDIFIGKESKSFLENAIEQKLTPLEKSVLKFFLEGRSYTEIAEITGRDEKSVDNSLQRLRRKVSKLLEDGKTD